MWTGMASVWHFGLYSLMITRQRLKDRNGADATPSVQAAAKPAPAPELWGKQIEEVFA